MREQIDELVKALVNRAPEESAGQSRESAETPREPARPLADALLSNQRTEPLATHDIGLRIDELRRAVVSQSDALAQNTEAVRETKAGSTSGGAQSVVSSVVKTMTSSVSRGLGPVAPLVSGLFKLFGRDKEEEQTPLTPFTLPDSVRIDAGLDANRAIAPIRYAQNGLTQILAPEQAKAPAPVASIQPAQVTVNVQAMDSRSFLDHSDDIARAVRDAMLHAHSLNDVVADI